MRQRYLYLVVMPESGQWAIREAGTELEAAAAAAAAAAVFSADDWADGTELDVWRMGDADQPLTSLAAGSHTCKGYKRVRREPARWRCV